MTWPKVLPLCLSIPLVLAAPAGPGESRHDSSERELRERVRAAVLATYFHGIDETVAREAVGREGVPFLIEWLGDAEFPRRDNLVAFLAFLDGPGATTALRRFVEAPPRLPERPEEDRALLLAPHALGHRARRGDPRALAALLEYTAPGGHGGGLAAAMSAGRYSEAMRDDLVEMSLGGLALSGAARARVRLAEVADRRSLPIVPGRSLRRQAASALERLREWHDTPARRRGARPGAPSGPRTDRSTLAPGAGEAEPETEPDPLAVDTGARSHETGLTFANHVDHAQPMTEARLDQVLADASYRAATENYTADVACCIKISRSGAAGTFGSPGDGLDVIDDGGELTSVLTDPASRVKVVRAINHCGGPGMNIIGCAYTPGNGMAVVRSGRLEIESVLWIHEYGHNTGLGHEADGRHLMHGTNTGSQNGLDQSSCTTFHSPSGATGASPVDIGVCHDDDVDAIASSMDNCPFDYNPGQADADGDGLGDVCESSAAAGLENISTRGRIDGGDAVLIGGFIIEGQGTKTVVIRVLGPSLSGMGVTSPLPDPTVALLSGRTVLSSNDDWAQSPDAAAIQASGLGPSDAAEAAVIATLGPGQYTAVAGDAGGATGVALVEVYDVGGSATATLTNLSTRGPVQTGQDVLIGGFIVPGSDPRTVLIRALGPTLAGFQVAGTLADPRVELLSGQMVLDQNDDWGAGGDAAAIAATGLAPPDPSEAAILATLAPGAYTAVVHGVGGATGVGLVEVYLIPPGPLTLPPPRLDVRPERPAAGRIPRRH